VCVFNAVSECWPAFGKNISEHEWKAHTVPALRGDAVDINRKSDL